MVSIEQLPVEILMKIFCYLPNYGHVSLVNKLFYNVVCSGNKFCVKLDLYPRIPVYRFYHQSIMDSIQNTQRKISKLSIRFPDWRSTFEPQGFALAWSDLLKILRKFSATIKYLKLEDVEITTTDFLEMLTCIPNVQHLCFSGIYGKTQHRTMGHLKKECLKLDHLRTLKLRDCEAFLVVFNKLPVGVLKEFYMNNWDNDFDSLFRFFAKQSKIKKLFLAHIDYERSIILPDHIFDHLNLESLECCQAAYNSRHAKILSKQARLTSLKLEEVDESVLNAITDQLCELETLDFTVDETLIVPFKRIAKLKKLKNLSIRSSSVEIIETISEWDNSCLTALNLMDVGCHFFSEGRPLISINLIAALANSAPNLKVLQCDYFFGCSTAAAIMEHFNFVEALSFNLDEEIDVDRFSENIDVDRCYNANLTKFTIMNRFLCVDSILTKWIDIFPNLVKLWIGASTMSQLKLILNGFKKMDTLNLFFDSSDGKLNLTADCLDCIKDHKSNWKWMRLHGVNALTAEHKRKLGVVFDVIIYNQNVYSTTLYMENRNLVRFVE